MKLPLLTAVITLFCAHSAVAGIVLTLAPQNQTVGVGTATKVQVRISGLGPDTAPSLGAFDLNVGFDPTLVALTGLTFGDPMLGDQLDLSGFGPINGSSTPSTGVVEFYEISLDSAATLDSLQPGTFTLATLQFSALRSGSTLLTPSLNSISDSQGRTLSVALQTGSINIAAVPEPGVLGLTLFAVIGMATFWLIRRS